MSTPLSPNPPAQAAAPAAAPAAIFPCSQILAHAAKLAMEQDRPIQLDYYVDSVIGKAYLAEDHETKEKVLVRSNEEFTSSIQKVYKMQEDFIIITENSIYIVSAKIPKRRIQVSALRGF